MARGKKAGNQTKTPGISTFVDTHIHETSRSISTFGYTHIHTYTLKLSHIMSRYGFSQDNTPCVFQ